MSDGWAAAAAATYPAATRQHAGVVLADGSVPGQIARTVAAYTATLTPDVRGLPAVVGAERLIASTIDQLLLAVVDGDTPRWLRRPRAYGSELDQGDLVQWLVTSMFWRGAGYLACTLVGDSWALDPVHPDEVASRVDRTRLRPARAWTLRGQPVDRVPAVTEQWQQGRTYLLHVPYLITPDHPFGVSPLQRARQSLEGFAQTEAYALSIFDRGTESGGRLETDQDLAPVTAERYAERWALRRRDRDRIPVLGNGLKYVNDLIDPAAAQWIEARGFNQATVYMMFGIPPAYMGTSLVGGQSSLSYANAQDNDRLFRRNAIEAFTMQIEDAFTELLGRPGRAADEQQLVRFDWSKWESPAQPAPTPAPEAAP